MNNQYKYARALAVQTQFKNMGAAEGPFENSNQYSNKFMQSDAE